MPNLVVIRTMFTLPYEVEPKMYNLDDEEEETCNLDLLPSGEWASFVLKKKTEFQSPSRPKIRRRGIRTNGGAGSSRPRPSDMETDQEQQQEQRNADFNSNNNDKESEWHENNDDELPHLKELGSMIISTQLELDNHLM